MSTAKQPILAALMFATAVPACTAGTVMDSQPAQEEREEIDSYIRSLEYLPVAPPEVEVLDETEPTLDGDYECVTQDIQETRQYEGLMMLAAGTSALWPGAMIEGGSVPDGLFTQMVMPRQPLTFSVSLENLAGAKAATLRDPNLSSFREALGDILARGVDGATPANIYVEIERVSSEEQLALALGARVGGGGLPGSISGSFDFNEKEVRSRYLVKYFQSYYTVDVDQPARPSGFFSDHVTLEDVSNKAGPGNPPLYVSSVTYGRVVLFTFESQYSAQELGAALEFVYSGGADINGEVSVTYKDIVNSSKTTAFILGGSGSEAAKSLQGYDELMAFLQRGGDYSKESPGAPITFKLAYLEDNTPTWVSFTKAYKVSDCARVSQNVQVTLNYIKVNEAADGANNNDLEIYGEISASANDDLMLFDKESESNVKILEGAKWPLQGFASQGVVDVTPQPGESIVLRAHLFDKDTAFGDEDLGEEVITIPYETGWRKDVSIFLTGHKSRVEVSVRLEPI